MQVFIGSDPRQPVAYTVVAHSVWTRATKPVSITRLQLSQLPITRRGLTEFTYTRFLIPYLCQYQGQGIFLDADMLCLGDITELLAVAYLEQVQQGREPAVWVVPHERRFERPSMMVFNNAQCTVLTPAYVEEGKNGLYDLAWAESVGTLPPEWNHLVGYDVPNPSAKLVHFTMGIPCWPETKECEFSAEWNREAKQAMGTVGYAALMGNSIHHQHVAAGALRKGAS